jgi:hypothetical protein
MLTDDELITIIYGAGLVLGGIVVIEIAAHVFAHFAGAH